MDNLKHHRNTERLMVEPQQCLFVGGPRQHQLPMGAPPLGHWRAVVWPRENRFRFWSASDRPESGISCGHCVTFAHINECATAIGEASVDPFS